jgi:hypothetical protein
MRLAQRRICGVKLTRRAKNKSTRPSPMLSILSWLIGSKVGRYVALFFLAAATVAVIVARVYSAGKRDEQLKQTQAALEAVRQRVKSDEAIMRLPASARRKRLLDEWSR